MPASPDNTTHHYFDVEYVDDVTVVRLAGLRLDSGATVNGLLGELESLIDQQHPDKLVLSFSRVPHVTSHAIGAITQVVKKINTAGGVLRFCEMHPAIRDAFMVLDSEGRLFPIRDCEGEALSDIRSKPR